MNNPTAYTPLESLLLFQALVEHGTDPNAFSRISESLKNDELIRDADTFDPGRLSSDALRELYLQVLTDDLRWETEEQDADGHTGKKRKLQIPPLPSLKEASVYKDRLPNIVDHLYEKYYDHVVRELREDERRFTIIQKEIADLEREERDERTSKEDREKIARKEGQELESSRDGKVGDSAKPTQGVQRQLSNPTPPNQSPRPEGLAISDVLNTQDKAPVSPQILQQSRNGSVSNIPHQRTASGDGRSRPSPLQPVNRQLPPQVTDQNTFKWEQYHGGPPHSGPAQYQQIPAYSPYSNQPPQYHPQPPPLRGSFSGSSSLGHSPMPQSPLNAGRGSPIVLPRPVGTPTHGRSGSPGRPHEQITELAGQQYRPTQSPHLQQGVHPPGFQFNTGFGPGPDGRPPSGNGPVPPNWQQLPPHPQYQPPYPPQASYPQAPVSIPPGPQYNSPYHPATSSAPFLPSRPSVSTPLRPFGQINIPQTPVTNGRSPFVKGSGTRYKEAAIKGTPKPPGSPTRPGFEPLSPVLAPTRISETPKKSSKESNVDKSKLHASRGTPRNRAGSVASATGSHRSQSVISHADELSLDEPSRIKRESATPDRRGKRKRSPERVPAGPPTHVYWTRNFPKVSVSALETISAHRSAGTFATSVKEKDAPGYRNSILRPQDLKSIKSAIMAGHRAAVALGVDEDWLPISEDLLPPKGIINYAQLEKELMRMFANAIMFNPDPNRGIERKVHVAEEGYDVDGMVKDTRAMFIDVQKIVGELRLAEKIDGEGQGEDEVDELAPDEEGSSKRRRR